MLKAQRISTACAMRPECFKLILRRDLCDLSDLLDPRKAMSEGPIGDWAVTRKSLDLLLVLHLLVFILVDDRHLFVQ